MPSPLRIHLSLARVSNLPTTWSNVLCAFVLVGGFQWSLFLGAILAISLFYVAGMYLNDWRDTDYDRKHRPERPIPSRAISRRAVLLWAVSYFLIALGISMVMEPGSVLWTAALIVCITIYDLDHKNNLMSPWFMAGCRALIYPWAASLTGQEIPVELWIACAAAYTYTLGLSYIARGILPLPLKLCCCLAVLLPAGLWMQQMGGQLIFLGLLALLAFLLWMAYCLSGLFRNPPRIGFTVGNLIAGFCLLDLLAVSVASPYGLIALVVYAFLFLGTLKSQTLISGT